MDTTSTTERLAVLRQDLHNPDAAIRFNAGLDLVKAGDITGVPALIEGFAHESPSVRLFHASRALAAYGQPAVPALSAALQADSPQVRVAAAYTLYQIDPAQLATVLPIALAAVGGDNAEALTDALHFLGEIGAAAQVAVPALIAALAKPLGLTATIAWFDDKRIYVCALLAKIGEPVDAIVPALTQLLQDEADEVRWGAACALGELGRPARAAIPALAAVVRNEAEVEITRVEAAYALAVMSEPETETLPVLLAAATSADWWVRAFTARLLGQMGMPPGPGHVMTEFTWIDRLFMAIRNVRRAADPTQSVVPTLINLLQDPNYNVQRNAVWGLALVGEQAHPAIPALIQALAQPALGPLAAEALAKIGEAAIPALAALPHPLVSSPESKQPLSGEGGLTAGVLYALRLTTTPKAQEVLAQIKQSQGGESFQPAPHHFYVQVPVRFDEEKLAAFAALYETTLAQGQGRAVAYTLPYPKHEFLRYLVEHRGLLIHGSGKLDIDVLKPMRYGIDAADHGNVSGIYADRDYVRPIYFAVIDGKRCFGQHNGFFDLTVDGQISDQEDQGFDRRFYKLAIGVNGLRREPWRNGMIYILPPDTFVYQQEWTSRAPVAPLMRLAVTPDDLPLRHQVWGADWRMFDGGNWTRPGDPFPFLKDVRNTPIHPNGQPPWLQH